MSQQPSPWTLLARHEATGREAFWRIESYETRVKFEYRVEVCIEVRAADGARLGRFERFMDWDNSTSVLGEFNEDGTDVLLRVDGALGLVETLGLPHKAADG